MWTIRNKKRSLLFIVERDVGKVLPPLPIHLVGESGMIGVKFIAIAQDLIGKPIQVLDVPGKPGDGVVKLIVLVVPVNT